MEWTEPIQGQIEGLVRGNLHLAGYDLQRQENGDVMLSFCVQVRPITANSSPYSCSLIEFWFGLLGYLNLNARIEQTYSDVSMYKLYRDSF